MADGRYNRAVTIHRICSVIHILHVLLVLYVLLVVIPFFNVIEALQIQFRTAMETGRRRSIRVLVRLGPFPSFQRPWRSITVAISPAIVRCRIPGCTPWYYRPGLGFVSVP